MIKLDPFERDAMISVLEMRTNYSYAYLKSLSDEQLEKLYKERVG
jgi:hypothetical protein